MMKLRSRDVWNWPEFIAVRELLNVIDDNTPKKSLEISISVNASWVRADGVDIPMTLTGKDVCASPEWQAFMKRMGVELSQAIRVCVVVTGSDAVKIDATFFATDTKPPFPPPIPQPSMCPGAY